MKFVKFKILNFNLILMVQCEKKFQNEFRMHQYDNVLQLNYAKI